MFTMLIMEAVGFGNDFAFEGFNWVTFDLKGVNFRGINSLSNRF